MTIGSEKENALSKTPAIRPIPTATHPAFGEKTDPCPKCGGKTHWLFESKSPTDRRLVAQPHIRGLDEWCYPHGIPPVQFAATPPK